MAKKLKSSRKLSEKVPETTGLNILKTGQLVLYKTNYIVDKTEVESIDKKTGIATLANQVKVSIGINPDGSLTKIGMVSKDLRIKVWDEHTSLEYDAYVARLGATEKVNIIKDNLKLFSTQDIIEVNRKLHKIINKHII